MFKKEHMMFKKQLNTKPAQLNTKTAHSVSVFRKVSGLFCVLLLVAAAGCRSGTDDPANSGGETTLPPSAVETTLTTPAGENSVSVLATTSIWADVVKNLDCNNVLDVKAIIPAGNSPHGYEMSMADRGKLDRAALVVANGASLEGTLSDQLEAAEEDGVAVLHLAEFVELLPFEGEHTNSHDEDEGDMDSDMMHDEGDMGSDSDTDSHDEDESEGADSHDEHGEFDPHIWFDPLLVSSALDSVAEALVEHAGVSAEQVCLEQYQTELGQVDQEIQDILSVVPADARMLVTNHDAFGYFADRYDFEVVGTVIPSLSDLAEATPGRRAELAATITDLGVPAIFTETQHSSNDAMDLSSELEGVRAYALYSGTLGEQGSGADTYVGMLRTNAETIAQALKPQN